MAYNSPGTRDAPGDTAMHHFTAFVRLPFPRGDFVDPPLVDWDANKDRALWKILSRNPRSSDLDWRDLATRFDVTLPFILQQAAWLYERQLSQVREQMRKVSKESAPAMQRTGSSDKRRQSAGTTESPRPGSAMGTPRPSVGVTTREQPLVKQVAPPMSRNPSTNTITQSRALPPASPVEKNVKLTQASAEQSPRQISATPSANRKGQAPDQTSSSSSDDSDDSKGRVPARPALSGSRLLRRPPPPRFISSKSARGNTVVSVSDGADEEDGAAGDEHNPLGNDADDDDDDDDDDETPAFLPLSSDTDDVQQQQPESQQQDLGATLRRPGNVEEAFAQTGGVTQVASQPGTDSSVSSAGSAAMFTQVRGAQAAPNALSPAHRAEMATQMSPGRRGTDGRKGSDGTRSLGSSFSDLDALDSSVTQSALEEALLSNLQHGGGSRISNISQALRSRHA